MKKPLLIIFGRFPQFGVGKQRLAAGIGSLKAWQFSRQTLAKTKRDLRDARWDLVHCATPDHLGRFKGQTPQGGGDLGRRLARQLTQAQKRPVLIMGSDVPNLSRLDIAQALKLLKHKQAILGPSTDGGFWCIGLCRAGRLNDALLENIAWSATDTYEETAKRLTSKGYTFGTAAAHDDVDDLATYATWKMTR